MPFEGEHGVAGHKPRDIGCAGTDAEVPGDSVSDVQRQCSVMRMPFGHHGRELPHLQVNIASRVGNLRDGLSRMVASPGVPGLPSEKWRKW